MIKVIDFARKLEAFAKEQYNHEITEDYTIFGVRASGIEVEDGAAYVVPVQNEWDHYDDLLFLLSKDDLKVFQGTVDPGKKYTFDPMNPHGCAHLCNGLWWFKQGLHHGHPAFNQAREVTVWRDKNKDNKDDQGIRETGWFGIDIHYGSGNPDWVGGYSAGCINTLGDLHSQSWNEFRDTLYTSKQHSYSGLYPLVVMDFPE